MKGNSRYDIVIIGAGHNGLVAATYLAKAGKRVMVLEANDEIGGATASVRAFPGFDAFLSRYSYLIALLPDKIVDDLGLNTATLSRRVSSYTPYRSEKGHRGLYVARNWDTKSERSFLELPEGKSELIAWREFYQEVGELAQRIAPTLLQPLLTRSELRQRIGLNNTWDVLMERPLGEAIIKRFKSDLVRGIVATDALIGTFCPVDSLQANICFLYHLMGNGTGEWKVPKGGMGALVNDLKRVALKAGVEIVTGRRVLSVATDSLSVTAVLESGDEVAGDFLLSNAAPQVLARLRGVTPPQSLDGSQLKINMLLQRLPRLKSGIDPADAFAGTFHVNESLEQLESAYRQAKEGRLPQPMPLELYCHTLTDPSILSEDLQRTGYHTLTLFGLHTPAHLFDRHHDEQRREATRLALASLDEYLSEPIESVLARLPDGSPALEVKTPLDLEQAIGMPRGNIFHRDLSFPFREEHEAPGWGVETDDPRIFICGAGARRGGGVSGIPGHNAAMAVLERYGTVIR